MKFKTLVEQEDSENVGAKPRSGIHQITSSPGKLILLVLAAGTTFFAGAVLLLSVMLCLMGRKDDVWRVVNRLLRRKQGQDKE